MMERLLALTFVALALILPGIQTATVWKACDVAGGKNCEVCHDEVGCFKMREACGENPANAKSELPESLVDISPTFLLYDKKNRNKAVELRLWRRFKPDFIKGIYERNGFDKNKQTKFLVDGFETPNVYGMLIHVRQQLFEQDKFNIFMLNWVSTQDTGTVDEKKIDMTYRRPYQNTRVVGKYLGMYIEYLHDLFGVTYDSMHIIGYNLGAHVAGYAGKYIRDDVGGGAKLAQITALAPSSPFFEKADGTNKAAECRLDKSDATFVDAIHSDRHSEKKVTMGMGYPIAHVDFYPNEGMDPHPGCTHMFCSHGRPLQYYEESIKGTCAYQSIPCTKSPPCPAGGCPEKCPAGGCPKMGYHVDKNAQGIYCLEVTAGEPFCTPKKN